MRKSCCFSEQRSTQSAWKQCGARHARLNRVKCTVAKWFAQSTSEWPKTLTPGDSRGSQSPWHAFLLYLSPCSERWSPRRAFRKENAGKNVKQKGHATGGRNEKIAPRKTAQSQFCHNKKAPTQGTATLVLFLTDRHLSGEKSYRSGKKERRKPEMETRRRFMLPSYHIPRSSV